MAFKLVKITNDDLKILKHHNIKNPFSSVFPLKLNYWCIDKEKDARLLYLGGQGAAIVQEPMMFALMWQDNLTIIETYREVRYTRQLNFYDINWEIIKIKAKPTLETQEDELITILKQSIIVWGMGNPEKVVHNCTFDSICEPRFREEVWF